MSYSTLVESLKRLYSSGRITVERLNEIKLNGKIDDKEYVYITSSL